MLIKNQMTSDQLETRLDGTGCWSLSSARPAYEVSKLAVTFLLLQFPKRDSSPGGR